LAVLEKPGQPPKWATIIGVVRNVIYDRLTEKRDFPCVYSAQYQNPDWFLSVMLRTKSEPRHFANFARHAVLAVNKEIPIYKIKTMDDVVMESFWERKFFGTLFTFFAGLALFLAAIGLYGVMAYSVRQRTQEIGVRMALGAQAADVLRLVTGHGMRLIGIGLVVGVVVAFFLTKLLQANLEGISAHDPISFGIVSAVLFVVGGLACYLPARTATRLDPVEALRYE
jgi:putative ABC transport system permease protein